jgi:hypothetical protein
MTEKNHSESKFSVNSLQFSAGRAGAELLSEIPNLRG